MKNEELLKKILPFYKKFQKSPIYFIERMWGLVPTPILPEYKSFVKECIEQNNFKSIEVKHFVEFENGKHIAWQQWLILLMVERAINDKGLKRISVSSGHGIGKAHPKSLEIETPNGKKVWGDIKIGDKLFGVDGNVNVINTSEQGVMDIFRVFFDDGSSTLCVKQHLWTIKGRQQRRKKQCWETIELQEIVKRGIKRKNGKVECRQFEIPQIKPVEFVKAEIDLDPYFMGVWLGDGTRLKPQFTNIDNEVIERIKQKYKVNTSDNVHYNITGIVGKLRKTGVLDKYSFQKYIPIEYKYNSSDIRLEVLRGLLDTDGYVDKRGSVIFSTTSKKLSYDIMWLVRSLGGKASLQPTIKKPFYYKNGKKIAGKDCFNITIRFKDYKKLFYIKRKQDRLKRTSQERYCKKWIDKVEYVGKEDCMCITVDNPDGLYLANDFIATHNSACLAWLVIWFLFCFQDAQVPCTAPTGEQMHDVLWKEIKLWLDKLPKEIADLFEWQNNHVRVKERPETWFARAKTARKESPEALAGIHAKHVMYVIDEACYDEKTEILTDSGFKLFKELKKTDKVLSQDNNGNAKFVFSKIIHKYGGKRKMYFYEQRGCNFAVTDNHKMLYSTRKVSQLRLKEIKDLDSSGNVFFPRKINYTGKKNDTFRIKEYNSGRKLYKSITFNFKDWVEFVAWYLSEGSISEDDYTNISQSEKYNKRNVVKIKNLLERMGIEYKYYNGTDFKINYKQIGKELKKYGKGFKNKKVPSYIKYSTDNNLFLDIFCLGDGYLRENRRIFYSSSKTMIDDIQEILYLSGSAGTLSVRPEEQKKWYKDHWIETKNVAYVLNERLPNKIKYKRDNVKVKEHSGYVYCVTTDYGNVFVRRCGKCMWSGNSGVPEEIFKTAEGALTSGNIIMIMISNPTRLIGYFKDSHHSDKASWQRLQFSSEDSPIVDEKYVNRIISKYGKDSDEYRIRVLGKFPRADAVDTKGYVQLLLESDIREVEPQEFVGATKMGIDPSGKGGDLTIWVVRDKFKAYIVAKEKISNPKSIAQKTLSLMEKYNVKDYNISIDNFGVGANVGLELATVRVEEEGVQKARSVYVNSVNVGEPADDRELYINKRVEACHRIKQWARKGGEFVANGAWRKELLSLRIRRELSGKYKAMSKREMVSEGYCDYSPNCADALILTFVDSDDEGSTGEIRVVSQSTHEDLNSAI